jgi:hypothetical protein
MHITSKDWAKEVSVLLAAVGVPVVVDIVLLVLHSLHYVLALIPDVGLQECW